MSRFTSVVLDVDSTLSGIEGIDWLAARRGPEVEAEVARLTDMAMRGEIPLEQVYGARINAVSPTVEDITALAEAYQAAVAPGAREALAELRLQGVEVVLVSGGIRTAILPLAASLGITPWQVEAVTVTIGIAGDFQYDHTSPLTRSDGKREVVERLSLLRPTLGVGDGMTDLALRPAVDGFAVFTGFVRREAVAAKADFEVASFQELVSLVLP